MFEFTATVSAEDARTEIGESEKQDDKTNLIVLKGGFSSGDSSYEFELKSDGTGVIFYTDFPTDSEEFAHEVKVEKLAREIEEAITQEIALQSGQNALEATEIENIRQETFSERLEEVFWEEINQTLEDPFFRSFYDDGEWGEEFGCERETVDGFIEFLELCVLTWTRFVCEGLKRERDASGKTWVSPHATINCGNLKDAPTFEHSTETFINVVGALAVKENAPYTVLREGFGRRAGGECYDWARKNKHRIFINLEQENKEVPVRLKIVARANLVNWLREQAAEGARIVKIWNLEN